MSSGKFALFTYWDEAQAIMKNIDTEDTSFIAAALSQENSVIWSEDKHFEMQNRILTLKTKEMINLLKD